MTIENLEAEDLTVTNPYVIGAAPDNLTGYTQIANALRVAAGTPKYFLGTNANNCIWVNTTKLMGAVFYSRIVLDVFGSESQGVVVCSLSGVGYQFLVNSTLGARLFAMTSGGVLGAQKGSTVATSSSAGEVVEVEFRVDDPAPGSVRLICKVNGVTRINFTEANANPDWYGGGVVRGSGRMRAIGIEYTASQTLTIGAPLVPGASRTDTCTGFADGAATISFSGVSIGVVIASGSLTYMVPMLAGGVVWPRLPAAGQTITLTQSALTAAASAAINLPAGFDTLRVGDVAGGAVANFSSPITDNDQYLGYWATITANDTWYFPSAGSFPDVGTYWTYRDGAVATTVMPRTDIVYQQNTVTGLITGHEVTLNAAGIIVNVTGVLADYYDQIAGPPEPQYSSASEAQRPSISPLGVFFSQIATPPAPEDA